MLDELKEEEIVNKAGGRFKLSALIQKRMVQLNQGSRPLVELDTQDKMQIVLQEIIQDKIFLDASNEVRYDDGASILGEMFDYGDMDSSDL
jgi:DNA-directed RNA polymerase subunit omega